MTITVLEGAVLRVAAWPIETLDRFTAPALATEARLIAEKDAQLREAARSLADRIHTAVSDARDADGRRWLLATRRALHHPPAATIDWPLPPLPERPAGAVLSADLVADIDRMALARDLLSARHVNFARAHDAALRHEVDELRTLASHPRFRCALAVTQPAVARQWDIARVKGPSTKARARRLEDTLLRFLLRSCGRPTPNGGWAGITPIGPADDDRAERDGNRERVVDAEPCPVEVAPGRAVADVTVDLDAFGTVLDAWRAAWRSRTDVPLRLEPTVFQLGDQLVYESHDGSDAAFVTVPTSPGLLQALDPWRGGQLRSVDELLSISPGSTASGQRLPAEERRAAIAHLRTIGLLREAIDLPTSSGSVWEALERVRGLLPETQRSQWAEAVDGVRSRCVELARAFERDDPERVAEGVTAIEGIVDALWRGVGLSRSRGRPVHLDLRVPFTARWTPDGREQVSAAIADNLAVHTLDGTAERYRLATAARVWAAVDPARPLLAAVAEHAAVVSPAPADEPAARTRSEQVRAAGGDPRPGERIWERLLRADPHRPLRWLSLDEVMAAREAVTRDAAVPASFGRCGSTVLWAGEGAWIRWGRPQPAMFTSRLDGLIGTGTAREVQAWLAQMGAVQFVGSDPENRNAALRTPSTTRRLDPHGVGLEGWAVSADSPTGGIMVQAPRADHRLTPVYDSAAACGRRDPCSRFLREAAMSHGWELLAWGFPILPAEQDDWHHLPRLVVQDARGVAGTAPTTISAQRWIMDGRAVDDIARLEGSERYLAWRSEIERMGVPDLVLLRVGLSPDGPELAVRTDSVLVVRATLDRLIGRPGDRALVFTELPGDPETWPVRNPSGSCHHLAELAVTWVDRRPGHDPPPPAAFPGEELPACYDDLAAVLEARRHWLLSESDALPGARTGDRAVIAEADALTAALVPQVAARAATLEDAASWLERSADRAGDPPRGAGRDRFAPSAAVSGRSPDLDALARDVVRARSSVPASLDLGSLRRSLEQHVGAVAERTGLDFDDVRSQVVGRLLHLHAVGLRAGRPGDLRAEAAALRALARATSS